MAKSQGMCGCPNQWGSLCCHCTTPSKQSAMLSSTFVETDIHGFKELVQKLTGLSEGSKVPVAIPPRSSKKGSPAAGIKTDENSCLSRKSEFKIQKRKQGQRKLEIQLGLADPQNTLLFEGKSYVLPSPVMLSPVTPLGPDLFTCSSSHHYSCNQSCSSSPMSCLISSCMRKEENEKFCFEDLVNTVKSTPKLLPLFPLHSPTEFTNN